MLMQHARSDMYFQSFHCEREGREGPLQLLFSEARVFCMHAPCTRRILQPHGVVYHRVRVRREYGQISFPCFPKLPHPVTTYFGCKNINVDFWRERTPQITTLPCQKFRRNPHAAPKLKANLQALSRKQLGSQPLFPRRFLQSLFFCLLRRRGIGPPF